MSTAAPTPRGPSPDADARSAETIKETPIASSLNKEVEGLELSRDTFITHWAEMGSSWGVPRSVAEVHALLFIEGRAMCADEIMSRLQVSRGSVSMTLRTLADWGIVTKTRQRGDRKEYFEAEQDVWNLLSLIVRARKRRELEPLLAALDETRQAANVDPTADATELKEHLARLDSMHDALRRLDRLSDQFIGRGGKGLDVAVRLLSSFL
ncbi:MAG: ArsR family transcriptional regulator [Phycisphaerales bacterium]|nr:ArsR family transcriptional regulator [Phycisphaerales bacterium]